MLVLSMWRRLFLDPQPDWQLVALVVVPIALIAWLAARLARRASVRIMQQMLGGSLATSSPLVKGPLRLIGFVTFALVFAVFLFPAFELAELRPRAGLHLRTLSNWTFQSG